MSGNVKFVNPDALIDFADLFLKRCRLPLLEYDVERCLEKKKEGNSPVPALMYCFSIIDLLGALVAGQATKGNTTANSKAYLCSYMKYPIEKIDLLWDKFYRHKIIHLSITQTAVKLDTGEIISWNLHDENQNNHLQILWKKEIIYIGDNCGQISIDGKFVINIRILKNDIIDSVNRINDGYLEKLKNDKNLQINFDIAINQIYEILALKSQRSVKIALFLLYGSYLTINNSSSLSQISDSL